jgi:hypothetical protein
LTLSHSLTEEVPGGRSPRWRVVLVVHTLSVAQPSDPHACPRDYRASLRERPETGRRRSRTGRSPPKEVVHRVTRRHATGPGFLAVSTMWPGPLLLGEVKTTLPLKECVIGLYYWPQYRILGRCFVCGRLMVLHSPWAKFVCERTPLPIEITEEGMAQLAVYEAERLIA